MNDAVSHVPDRVAIPQAAPELRLVRHRKAIKAAIGRLVDSGHYILGPQTEAFEEAFAAYLEIPHCVGVASGTDAITLALRALGTGPGDEVVTVAMTAAGTAAGIAATGAAIRFVDVEPVTRGMDPDALGAAIGARTTAVVAVHLHGIPCRIAEIAEIARRRGLVLVEDCAQAHGATVGGRRVGTFGHAGTFSFYPTKNLGGMGDGGAVVTDAAGVAEKVRRFRQYGWSKERVAVDWGINSRLDEVQAAILGCLLPHLDSGNAERRKLAAELVADLAGLPLAAPPLTEGAVYHQFAIELDRREELAGALLRSGIHTAVHYRRGLHREPRFADPRLDLPQTDSLASRMLSLPIQPEVLGGHRHRVVAAIRQGVERCSR